MDKLVSHTESLDQSIVYKLRLSVEIIEMCGKKHLTKYIVSVAMNE